MEDDKPKAPRWFEMVVVALVVAGGRQVGPWSRGWSSAGPLGLAKKCGAEFVSEVRCLGSHEASTRMYHLHKRKELKEDNLHVGRCLNYLPTEVALYRTAIQEGEFFY